jgi:amidase
MNELCFLTATELTQRIRSREISCREVMDAHLRQIERVNPKVNAVVTLLAEQAVEQASAADEALARGDEVGPLFGLPIAHKDTLPTKGIRTTRGSRIYADHVPAEDALMIERVKAAGAISIGKTNVPEFGAGSQTFNEVFGATANPYDVSKTCGGSSGGTAVALACGMMPIGDGSDTGGSLRNPAAFCNVVGFRTSPGRVPMWPRDLAWFPISVQGPLGRTVEDVALLLSVMAGQDDRVPISIREPGEIFRRPLARDFRGVRIAWSDDFGELPIDPRVTETFNRQRGVFESLGCIVDDAAPDFAGAEESFQVWRAWTFESSYGELTRTDGDRVKDTVHWNCREGEKLTGPQISRAERTRTALYHRMREFLAEREYMIFPVTQVPAFDINQPYVTEINGVKMQNYIEWMKSCYYITVTGLPAISVPGGFTHDGLPVGLQIVGRHQADFSVLQLAYAFQEQTGYWKQRPGVL